jgi:GTPase involved in cell partitioning and DNA repair
LHLHPRVDFPDDNCTHVPEGGDGGADGDVHYVTVDQDLDQIPEGTKANHADEGKPRIINPSF